MLTELEGPLAALDQGKAAYFARVDALDGERRTQPIRPDGLTPAQIVAHLAISERVYVDAMAQAAETGGRTGRATRSPAVGLLCFVLRRRIPVPMPDSMRPPDQVTWADARRVWDETRADLTRWLESVDHPTRQPLLVHPQLGPLSAAQVLAILDAHQVYHEKDA